MERVDRQTIFQMAIGIGLVLFVAPFAGALGFIFWSTEKLILVSLGMRFLLISGVALIAGVLLAADLMRFLVALRRGVALERHSTFAKGHLH